MRLQCCNYWLGGEGVCVVRIQEFEGASFNFLESLLIGQLVRFCWTIGLLQILKSWQIRRATRRQLQLLLIWEIIVILKTILPSICICICLSSIIHIQILRNRRTNNSFLTSHKNKLSRQNIRFPFPTFHKALKLIFKFLMVLIQPFLLLDPLLFCLIIRFKLLLQLSIFAISHIYS